MHNMAGKRGHGWREIRQDADVTDRVRDVISEWALGVHWTATRAELMPNRGAWSTPWTRAIDNGNLCFYFTRERARERDRQMRSISILDSDVRSGHVCKEYGIWIASLFALHIYLWSMKWYVWSASTPHITNGFNRCFDFHFCNSSIS